MTISTTSSSINYLGNGSTTVFTFPFVGVQASDLEVILTTQAGVSSILAPSAYTVVINAVPSGGLWGIGGSITYPISGTPVQTGNTITINRMVPYEQTVTISNQGAFYPQAVEQGLDLLELQIQQLETASEYAIQAPITDVTPPNILPPAAARANGFLGFDSTGQPIILFGSTSPPATLTSATPRRVVVTTTSTVNVLSSDNFKGISLYQSGAAITTVQLPVGQGPFPVFDASLNCSTFPIKILPPSGLTIEGQASYYLVFNGQSVNLYNDGNQIVIV